jgi:hypothetical protein
MSQKDIFGQTARVCSALSLLIYAISELPQEDA